MSPAVHRRARRPPEAGAAAFLQTSFTLALEERSAGARPKMTSWRDTRPAGSRRPPVHREHQPEGRRSSALGAESANTGAREHRPNPPISARRTLSTSNCARSANRPRRSRPAGRSRPSAGGEAQVRDVRAGDQQHEPDRAEQRQNKKADLRSERALQERIGDAGRGRGWWPGTARRVSCRSPGARTATAPPSRRRRGGPWQSSLSPAVAAEEARETSRPPESRDPR